MTSDCKCICPKFVKYYAYVYALSPLTLFQCKIDNMIMFHAIAKFVDRCTGGTSLKKQLGVYVSSRTMKFKVLIRIIYYSLEHFCMRFFFASV